MNREDILKMEAGRELDKLVGKYITFTNAKTFDKYENAFLEGVADSNKYSTNMSDAWNVVEQFESLDIDKHIDEYTCWIYNKHGFLKAKVSDKTASLAICKAALLTTLEE